jgi:hypothetical protein
VLVESLRAGNLSGAAAVQSVGGCSCTVGSLRTVSGIAGPLLQQSADPKQKKRKRDSEAAEG